jgi:hypothetical protein
MKFSNLITLCGWSCTDLVEFNSVGVAKSSDLLKRFFIDGRYDELTYNKRRLLEKRHTHPGEIFDRFVYEYY